MRAARAWCGRVKRVLWFAWGVKRRRAMSVRGGNIMLKYSLSAKRNNIVGPLCLLKAMLTEWYRARREGVRYEWRFWSREYAEISAVTLMRVLNAIGEELEPSRIAYQSRSIDQNNIIKRNASPHRKLLSINAIRNQLSVSGSGGALAVRSLRENDRI
jgi:hypothetical protein